MANYAQGSNRIYYVTSAFKSYVITVYFYTPKLEKTQILTFTELEPGVYYLDVAFTKLGDYIGIFFEDEAKKAAQVFKIIPRDRRWMSSHNYKSDITRI